MFSLKYCMQLRAVQTRSREITVTLITGALTCFLCNSAWYWPAPRGSRDHDPIKIFINFVMNHKNNKFLGFSIHFVVLNETFVFNSFFFKLKRRNLNIIIWSHKTWIWIEGLLTYFGDINISWILSWHHLTVLLKYCYRRNK